MSDVKLRTVYRIEGGILDGTEIEPLLMLVSVRYPHRKTKDLYVPPIKTEEKEVKTWHCCQDNCPNPNFEGSLDALVEHLVLHKGGLLKPWNKQHQLKTPIPAVKIPPNEWDSLPKGGVNDDRRFVVSLYIDRLKATLKKQGLEIVSV